ncbi:MAG: hypothetical protein MJY74_01500 [Bacteroidaceae bacterium]|nr:hypothetical protein [Bacteroidaceae bacterium]
MIPIPTDPATTTNGSVEKQWGKAPEITIVKFTRFAIRMVWLSEYR